MTEYFGEIGNFYLSDTDFSAPKIKGNDIEIFFDKVDVYSEHPLAQKYGNGFRAAGIAKFINVISSVRDISEYKGDPKDADAGFKESYIVKDIDKMADNDNYNIYCFDGLLKEPLSFCVWDIVAESFEFEIDEETIKLYPE